MMYGTEPEPIDTSLESLRVSTGWIDIEVASEPFVIFRNRKYHPVLKILQITENLHYLLYLTAGSLALPIEDLREERGALQGQKLRIKKESEDRFSKYEIEILY